MKSIVECLTNSLNEGREQTIVFFNYEDPEKTIIYQGSNPKAVELIQKSSFDYKIVEERGDVLLISHYDEWDFVTAYSNIAKFKSENLKSIKDSLKDIKAGEDYVYVKTSFVGLDIEGEDEISKVLKMSDSQLYKKFVVDSIERSYIDGDSSTAYTVVDTKAKKVLIQGGMDIKFYNDNDVLEMFHDPDAD